MCGLKGCDDGAGGGDRKYTPEKEDFGGVEIRVSSRRDGGRGGCDGGIYSGDLGASAEGRGRRAAGTTTRRALNHSRREFQSMVLTELLARKI